MSHSSFKIIANDEPISHNLVILVNKNGSIGTDTVTLQNLLTSKETPNTGVTVLRETSPTPSITEEIEEERIEQRNMMRRQFKTEHPSADEDEIEEHLKKISGMDVPHVTLSVDNFFPPDQARKFANDVLHLGGIVNPQMLMPIDFNFRRKIIENDHCYTNLTQAPEPISKKAKDTKGKREVKTKVRHVTAEVMKEDSSDSEGGEEEEECDDEEQSAEEEEISFSESDDDNDMDFSVNDRFGKKGTKKKRKYRRQNHKSISFKDLMEGSADLNTTDDEPKKKYGKVSKKASSSSIPSRPAVNTSKVASAPSTSNKTQQSIVKKVQTQLKNSPIIRKEPQFTPSSTFKAATTSSSVVSQVVPVNNPLPSRPIQTIIKKSTEKEIVESIAKDLEKSFTESNPSSPIKKPIESQSIPTIMQILETNTSAEVLDQSLATLEHIDSADGATSIEEINDALIAALGTEAIDELFKQGDLMNFDAAQNSTAISHTVVALKPSIVPLLSDSISSSPMISDSPTIVNILSPSTPKILNRQAPQKDPIKIVKNGRIFTLPPIEAPATRGAKRRAQGDPITPIATTPVAPTTSISVLVTSTSPVSTGNKVIKVEKAIKESDSKNSSRRSSLNKSEGGGGKNSRRQSTAAAHGEEEKDEDINSDATWNSEDDPDRLWCICKQPHNNRFMICCDKCEDWFHGTCVSITKAQGKSMEEKNKKWLCPNCKTGGVVKKDTNKKLQLKLTKFFSKNQKESTDEDVPMTAMCVVCSKSPARTGSIYCSDECIQNQATKHLDEATTTPKTPTSVNSMNSGGASPQKTEGKRGNILKDQEGKVIVYDRTTGKLLSSKVWPHMNNLSTWLSNHPNCEIVKPGSSQATQLMLSLSNKKLHSASLQTPTISSTTPTKIQGPVEDLFSNPVKINTGNNPTTPTTPLLSPTGEIKKSSSKLNISVKSSASKAVKTVSVTSSTPQAQSLSQSQSHSHKAQKPEEKKGIKRQFSDEKSPPSTNTSVRGKAEHERQNVRNNFETTLASRMKDFEHATIAKMTNEEVKKFAKHLELEMFLHFNKDTKDKYKNKFRSLKFNLSDVKNKTLLEKICARTLSPQQLVTLPPSELASEELAKWRVDEEKHQLEIITKAELDALTQNKIIVKSRKGEEIIETKTSTADMIIPGSEEDLESAISKNILSHEDGHGKAISLNLIGHSVTSPLSSPSISSSTSRSRSKSDRRSRSRSKSRGRDHHHKSSTSSKHKKKSRSRSPKHHHSSSHHSHSHSSRDKSREKSREKSKLSEHQEKLHRDKSKSNEKEKNSTSTKPKESRNDTKKNHTSKDNKEKEQIKDKKRDIQPEQEDVDLVGKILDSMGVHLEPKKIEKVEEKPAEVTSTDLLQKEQKISLEPINEHQLEIEIYSGSMFMAEVAKFDVTASIVSGNVDDIIKKLPTSMEIVGRIEQNIVFDYLDKVKKHGKELALLRFASTDESSYFSLFSYLNTRQRYGVIKSPCPTIKDFYLIPVEAGRSLPSVLLPIIGPGFIEGDDHKPDLLLGVILKISHDFKQHVKKPIKEPIKKSSKPSRPPVEHIVPIQILPAKHKSTHHGSSSSGSKLTMGLPEIRSEEMKKSLNSPLQGDDEPYEPFDDDDEPMTHFTPPSASTSSVNLQANSSTLTKLNSSDDLESQVEFLSRQIEQRQMEIQKLAQQKAMELNEEQASRIYEQVSVPYNLSEMLSTIKASSENQRPMVIEDDDDDDLEYVPIPSSSHSNIEYRASSTSSYGAINNSSTTIVSSMMDIDERINQFREQEMPVLQPLPIITPQPSRLAQMSDADLMKLVPDDAFEAPPPPIIGNIHSSGNNEPPIPGLEYDDIEMMER